jgi:hypothetical protein
MGQSVFRAGNGQNRDEWRHGIVIWFRSDRSVMIAPVGVFDALTVGQ